MNIYFKFATKPDNVTYERFKMDEYVSDLIEDEAFQETKVFINQVSDFPFDFNFQVPFSCFSSNYYSIEKSQEQTYFVGGKQATCQKEDRVLQSFGTTFVTTRETLCEMLIIQSGIYKECNCFLDAMATKETNYSSVKLCGESLEMLLCAYRKYSTYSPDMLSTQCLPSCIKTEYISVYRTKAFFSSSFSKKMDGMIRQTESCSDDSNSCPFMVNCIFHELFPNNANITCDKNAFNTAKRTARSTTVSGSVQSSENSSNNDTKCSMVSIDVEIRPKMKIQKESLIVEVNTLLSQIGGMCSFFTGLTFTLIAEILETLIFWIIDFLGGRLL